MEKVFELFPQISRAGEYVAVFNFAVPTRERLAYVFLACDGFSEFGFNLGVEPNENPETVIKAIRRLTENKDFGRMRENGFTLVFNRWEDLSDRLESVVKPLNGKVLFYPSFHAKIAEPMVSSFKEYIQNGPKK